MATRALKRFSLKPVNALVALIVLLGAAALISYIYVRELGYDSPTTYIVVFAAFVIIMVFLAGLRLALSHLMGHVTEGHGGIPLGRKKARKKISKKTAPQDPLKLLLKGQRELTRRNFEGAAESFSFAAWAYTEQQKWSDAGENFQRAAEAYSNDKNLQFGSACEYCFALACFIVNGDSEDANNTMQKVNQVLHNQNIDSKGKEIISKLLTFLELIQKGESEKAQNTWKTLEKKIPEWMYAFPDQAQNLLEKCLEQAQKKP